jgi:hypothetical protein
MRIKKALLAFIALVCITAYASPDVLALASNSWNQTIEIAVPLREKILDFSMENATSGSGSEPDPYPTYTSNVPLTLTVAGPGEIIITDKAGNVLYTFNKTSSSTDTFTFTVDLLDGIGLYELTATLVNPSDPNIVYDSRSLYILYLATPIIPIPPPAPPNTGVIYLGSRAFLTRDFIIVIWTSVIIFSAIFIAARKKQKR